MLCQDQNKTESFYSDLGVDVQNLGSSDLALFFSSKEEAGSGATNLVTIECDDLDLALDFVEKSGIQVIVPFTIAPWGATVIIADPDGRHIVLTEDINKFSKR